jgi:hypothetical protein
MEQEEQQYPYQVIAITDLANNYSHEHFRFAIGHCRDVITKGSAEDNRSDQQRARYRILRYLDLQLARATNWVDQEADLMAWVMRNLIELQFWAKFVSQSEEKAKQFLDESYIDLKEVAEKLEKLRPDDAEPIPELPSVSGRRVSVKPAGEQEELTWKMACKMVHPSSYVINNFESTVKNPLNNQLFALQILLYGWRIVSTFHHIVWITEWPSRSG